MADIGNVYEGTTTTLYTGDVVNQQLSLLQPYGSGTTPIDFTKDFTITRKNIVVTSGTLSGNASGITAQFNNDYMFYVNFVSTGVLACVAKTGSSYPIAFTSINIPAYDTPLDLQADYVSSTGLMTFKYKLSSASAWTTLASGTYTMPTPNGYVSYLRVSGRANEVESPLSGVEVVNDGVVVFSRDAAPSSTPIPKIGGSDISKIYLGSEEISKIYLGSEVVYEASSPTPTDIGDAYSRTYSNGSWSSYALKNNNTLSGIEEVRLLQTDRATPFPEWDGTGIVTMYSSFTIKNNAVDTLNGSITTLAYHGAGSGVLIRPFIATGFKLGLSVDAAAPTSTVQLSKEIKYDIKLEYNATTSVGTLYYKENSSQSYTQIGQGSFSYNPTYYYLSINNYLASTVSPYPDVEALDVSLEDVRVEANGTVVFQRS